MKTEYDQAESETRLENVYELFNTIEGFSNENQENSISSFLENVALMSDIDSMNEEKNSQRLMREEDLERHMPREGEEDEVEEVEEEKGREVEQDQRVEELIQRDNQIRHALQLLQTWTIFSQIKTRP